MTELAAVTAGERRRLVAGTLRELAANLKDDDDRLLDEDAEEEDQDDDELAA